MPATVVVKCFCNVNVAFNSSSIYGRRVDNIGAPTEDAMPILPPSAPHLLQNKIYEMFAVSEQFLLDIVTPTLVYCTVENMNIALNTITFFTTWYNAEIFLPDIVAPTDV
ncbi:hypothetical protein J6590_084236 [Homalodisca vitripennis]|nr:hypothetical protein J6590_084236 [Homalodisca vitripennis]